MDPRDFEKLAGEDPAIAENIEFLTAFCIRENGTQEMLETLMSFYDKETINGIIDFYKDTSDSFVYQGFDPARLIVHMMEVHKSWKQKNSKIASDIVSELSDDIKIAKSEDFVKEMTILIILFLVRGSNINKIALKSVPSMTKLIKFYAAKYSIFSRDSSKGDTSKESLSPKTVTLARIASCFPMVTVSIFCAGIGRTLAPSNKYFNEPLPRAVLSPGIASVIPKSIDVEKSIHHVILYINYVNDKIINSNKKNKETSLEGLISYHKAAFNSQTLSDALRFRVCEDIEIMAGGNFTNGLLKLEKKAIELLTKLPGADDHFPISF